MSGELEHKAVEIITQIQHLAPAATSVALDTARMDAISNGVTDTLCLVLALSIIIFWRKIYWPWVKNAERSFDNEVAHFLAGAGLVIVGGILGCIGVFGLADPWLYASYFHPELWLAHKIIG